MYDEDRSAAEKREAELIRQRRTASRHGGRLSAEAQRIHTSRASSPDELFDLLRRDRRGEDAAVALIDLRKDRDRGRLPGLLIVDILSWNAHDQFGRVLPVAWTAATSATLPKDVGEHGGCGLVEIGWSQRYPENLIRALASIHDASWPPRTAVVPPNAQDVHERFWFAERKPLTSEQDRATRAQLVAEHTTIAPDDEVVDLVLEYGRGLSMTHIRDRWSWHYNKVRNYVSRLDHRPDAFWEGKTAAQQLAEVHDDPRLPPLPPQTDGLVDTALVVANEWQAILTRYPVFTRVEQLGLGRYFSRLATLRTRGFRAGLTEAKHLVACEFAHLKLREDPGIHNLLPDEQTTRRFLGRAILKMAYLAAVSGQRRGASVTR